MPIAERQDMFPQEYCSYCKKPGVLYISHRKTYTWKCCSGTWYTEGSKMNMYNELVDPYIEEPDD